MKYTCKLLSCVFLSSLILSVLCSAADSKTKPSPSKATQAAVDARVEELQTNGMEHLARESSACDAVSLRRELATLLFTLWPTEDKATAGFMTDFYKKALTSGDAPESLEQTQRELLVSLRTQYAAMRRVWRESRGRPRRSLCGPFRPQLPERF